MALAIAMKRETKLMNTQAHAIMDTQMLTMNNMTNLGQNLQTHTNSMTDAQTAILEAVKSLDQKLEARDAERGRDQVWQNPTDLIGLSKYLESVAIARYSPPPTNAAGMSTFDENFDDDALPDELQCEQSPNTAKYDKETEIEKLLIQESETCAMSDEGQTALHLAAQHDPYLTQMVLSVGLHPNELNIEGETPLMSAVMAENMETVNILLKAGANVNAARDDGRTPLHYAVAQNKDVAIAQLLLRRKTDIAAVDGNGQTALFTAAFYGNDTGCRCLLDNGATVQAREVGGWTALHYLAMRGNSACMDRLLHSAGADVETYYDPERYGLQSNVAYDTSSKRKIALVRLFLDHGLDINALSRGYTALSLAVLTCQDMLVRTLLSYNASAQGTSLVCLNWGLSNENLEQLVQRGADIEARDSRHHKTALIWASETGSPAAVKVLLDYGAEVNAQDSQGISALRYAAANARTETVRILLEKGADPSLPDIVGKTTLVAVAWGRPFSLGGRSYNPLPADREKTASLLINAGADPSVRDNWGGGAIHYAAQNGYLEVLKLLHSTGNVDLRSEWQDKTPLDFAMEHQHTRVVKWLKRHLQLEGKKNHRFESDKQA